MLPNIQEDPVWLSNFNIEASTFYEESPLPTQDMSIQFEMNSTMGDWNILRQEDDIKQEALPLESIALEENQFIEWPNYIVEAIERVTSPKWMELSHLREEAPILNETRDIQDIVGDKVCDQESSKPLHYSMMEESHVI